MAESLAAIYGVHRPRATAADIQEELRALPSRAKAPAPAKAKGGVKGDAPAAEEPKELSEAERWARWLQQVLRRYRVRSSELPEYLAELRTEREQLQAGLLAGRRLRPGTDVTG